MGGLRVCQRNRSVLWALAILLVACGCSPARRIEATSLLDQPLYAPQLAEGLRAEQETLLEQARAGLRARPDDPEAVIWVGRRLAYLGRYREAIRKYSQGIEEHPDDPRLYRHRGHRRITVRELDLAIRDLESAADRRTWGAIEQPFGFIRRESGSIPTIPGCTATEDTAASPCASSTRRSVIWSGPQV